MKPILPILALAVLASASVSARGQTLLAPGQANQARSSTSAAVDADAGAKLLRTALAAVDAQQSIAAKVRYRIDLLGRPLLGDGRYLQQGRGPGRRLCFELNLAATVPLSMIQISDGATFWMQESLDDRTSESRVDLGRLRNGKPKSPAAMPLANPWLALGGLAKLLADLDQAFEFSVPAESRLDEVRVVTTEGRWKTDRLLALLPDQKEKILAGAVADTSKLAPNLPDRVVLHVGGDDSFPYRIEYWRSEPGDQQSKAADRGKLLVVMELYEVQFGAPLNPTLFVYRPTTATPVDRTEAFFEKLGLEEVGPAGAKTNQPPRR